MVTPAVLGVSFAPFFFLRGTKRQQKSQLWPGNAETSRTFSTDEWGKTDKKQYPKNCISDGKSGCENEPGHFVFSARDMKDRLFHANNYWLNDRFSYKGFLFDPSLPTIAFNGS